MWSAQPLNARSGAIFREQEGTGHRPRAGGLRDSGWAGDNRDGPARFGFHDRPNVAGDHRSAGSDSRGSAVELRDTETPDFLLVSRFKRDLEALLCFPRSSSFNLSRV